MSNSGPSGENRAISGTIIGAMSWYCVRQVEVKPYTSVISAVDWKQVEDSGCGRFIYENGSSGTIWYENLCLRRSLSVVTNKQTKLKGLGLGVAETVESDRWRCQLLTSEQGGAGRGLRDRRLAWLFLKVDTDYKRRSKSPVVSCRNLAT